MSENRWQPEATGSTPFLKKKAIQDSMLLILLWIGSQKWERPTAKILDDCVVKLCPGMYLICMYNTLTFSCTNTHRHINKTDNDVWYEVGQ